MKRLTALITLAAAVAAAQTTPAPANRGPEPRLIVLKHADPRNVCGLLGIFAASCQPNPDMHAMAVAANAAAWPAIEDAVLKLDVPGAAVKNVEMTVYYLAGSNHDGQSGGAVPADLERVVAQLRTAFTFKNYRLLDSLVLRSRVGQAAEASGLLPTGGVTQFKMRAASISTDGTIHIDNLKAGLRTAVHPKPNETQYLDTGINTDIDVKDGQKVVVGKSSLEESALFVVLSAKILQ